MDIPQTKEPNLSQKRLPLSLTNRNMKAMAESNFTTPKIPVRNSDDDTEVKPADMKITGASISKIVSVYELMTGSFRDSQ
jgi:hypothetical protein